MVQEKKGLHRYEGEKERDENLHMNTGFPFFFFMNMVNVISAVSLMLNKS